MSRKAEELNRRAQVILTRLWPAGRTPMLRFCFPGWEQADYQALDKVLYGMRPATSRHVLPGDEGILVGSDGWPAAKLVVR